MARAERYTLMNREHEVLTFGIDSQTLEISDVKQGPGAAGAPPGLFEEAHAERILFNLLRRRSVSQGRKDHADVLAATGASNAIELALRSGGFSLTDQIWYRKEDSDATWERGNYFDNEWDPAFGQAVLDRDYHALANASVYTPDVATCGRSIKAWVPTPEGPHMLKASAFEEPRDIVCEVIATRLLTRLLPEADFVPHTMVERKGELFVSCPVMVGRDEEFVNMGDAALAAGSAKALFKAKSFTDFHDLYRQVYEALHVQDADLAACKMKVASMLALSVDSNPVNYGLIHNVETGEMRPAPLFDLGCTMASPGLESLFRSAGNPQIALLMVAIEFGKLDFSWDYSWYEPSRLDGFAEELMGALAQNGFFPQDFVEFVAYAFEIQLAHVNATVEASRRQEEV